MAATERRSGVTLLELMVGMAVLTVLAAILLPAVQSTRAAAWKVQCLSNLRQLGIATESFLSARRQYPKFYAYPLRYPGQRRHASFQAQLLPFLDQQPLYDQLDLYENTPGMTEPPTSQNNALAMTTTIPVFVCPADGVPSGGNSYRACYGTTPGIHATWKRGRPRTRPLEEEALWGILIPADRPGDVKDGLSNTVLFSERVVGDGDADRYTPWADVIRVGGHNYRPADAFANCTLASSGNDHASYLGWSWLPQGYAQTAYNHVLTPNSRIPDCFDHWNFHSLAQGAMTARSYHAGGVNVVLADGSARFVSEGIDLQIWRGLGTYDGGEVIGDF